MFLRSPSDSRSLELLGKCWLMEGEFHKATDVLERAAELDPHSSEIDVAGARLWAPRRNRFAFNAIGSAVKAARPLRKPFSWIRPTRARWAICSTFNGAPGIVGGGLDRARGLMPHREVRPRSDLFRSGAARRTAETIGQRGGATAAGRGNAPHIGQVLNLARFLALHGRFEESEQEFQRAERLFPGSPRVTFARADTCIKTRRHLEEARTLLKQYLAAQNLTPDDPSRSEAMKLLKKIEGS